MIEFWYMTPRAGRHFWVRQFVIIKICLIKEIDEEFWWLLLPAGKTYFGVDDVAALFLTKAVDADIMLSCWAMIIIYYSKPRIKRFMFQLMISHCQFQTLSHFFDIFDPTVHKTNCFNESTTN